MTELTDQHMTGRTEARLSGRTGERHAVTWRPSAAPRHVVLLSHGYGEHVGRYEHVAARLTEAGAVVYGLDHEGHGRSAGERVLIADFESVVDDLQVLAQRARSEHGDLPFVLLGHSMGGLIALRYAQRHAKELVALVLSGPQVGNREMLEMVLQMPDIPHTAIDPSVLSRDPAVGEAYANDPLVWQGGFRRETLAAMAAAQEAVEVGGELGVPTLWLHGADDQLVPPDVAASLLDGVLGPHSTRRVYPGARHEILNETNQDEVLADIVRFIDDVAG
jgi:alpha-beta hydrolase superfamily lysophospholipase